MKSTNKRIAKNTILLYIRMFVTMVIAMWTSRVVINALGFTDQGLYNVVGGLVGFLSLVTASIGGSISRFLTYELGRNDYERVNMVIRNGIAVQFVLSAIVILLGETIGLWFVYNKLVIPPDRMFAVLVVYQLSLASFVVGLISSVPNAIIIAHERMNVFAYVSIVQSIGNFIIAFAIAHSGFDRLILYAGLQLLLLISIRIFYAIYCKRAFREVRFQVGFNREIFMPIFGFAGWNMIGTSAAIFRGSGTSVLLNMFGGAIANTINGIAYSVGNLVTMFVNDFTTAFNPQIIKKYAAREYQSLIQFLHQCSKFSYCLLLVMAVPVMVNIEPLLVLWLKKIPEGTVIFARLTIVFSMIECISRPLITAKSATGQIRVYQIVVGGILLLTIPLTYLFLKFGLPIWFAYISMVLTSLGAFVARMVMLRGSIPGWSSSQFLFRTVSRCMLATLAAFVFQLILCEFMPANLESVLAQCVLGFFFSSACVYILACTSPERVVLAGMVKTMLRKLPIINKVVK